MALGNQETAKPGCNNHAPVKYIKSKLNTVYTKDDINR